MIIYMFHQFGHPNGNPQNSGDHGIPPNSKIDYNKVFKTHQTNPCALIIDLKGVEQESNLGTIMYDWCPLLPTDIGNLGVKEQGPEEMQIFQSSPENSLWMILLTLPEMLSMNGMVG